MSPPIHKDWWLAAALTGAALPAAIAQPAPNPDSRQTGVVTSVTQQGATRSVSTAPIFVESAAGQRLATGPDQTLHVLFSDQSALTVGPNSEVVIAEYKFDTEAKDGRLLVNLTKGLLRVVGGLLSKKRETMVRTATATIGIRGGISVVESNGGNTNATFLFGQQMRMTDNSGNSQTVTRPGFSVGNSGGSLLQPTRVNSNNLANLTRQLERTFSQPPSSPAPAPAPAPSVNQQVNRLAPDRLGSNPPGGGSGGPGGNNPPTLRDLLGTTQPDNQS